MRSPRSSADLRYRGLSRFKFLIAYKPKHEETINNHVQCCCFLSNTPYNVLDMISFVVTCRDQTKMRPMTGVKRQRMAASLLKTVRMLGRLEHEEGTLIMFGCRLLTVSMMTCECIPGVARPLSLEECRRSKSRHAVMRGLANALTLPSNGRRERTPLDERDGLPVVASSCIWLQTFKSFAN